MASSVNNYLIGKGVVSFKPDGGAYADMGNCSTFEFTPTLTKLEHFSSRVGTKTKDLTVITEKKGTLRLVLDEFMVENLELALLGTTTTGTTTIFTEAAIRGSVKLVMSNDVGPKYTVEFPNVDIIPSAAISFISEEFATIELEGEVSADAVTGSFGTLVPVV